MRRHYRALALAISLVATPFAFAQSGGGSSNSISRSPGGEVFFYQPLQGQARSGTLGRDVFANTGIGRPNPRNQHQVTPVPEPSQWAMMLAGLALVGFVVRRNARRDPQ
jgi:hypothetical protein